MRKENKMENKELQMERRKIAEKAAFVSWMMTNEAPIGDVIHSKDQFTNWDVCFHSGSTQQKVVCEMKARKSKYVYKSQMIEKYKWDFLLSINQARPELLPLYLVFYDTHSRKVSGEFDLRCVTPPQWVLEYHWEDEKRLRKVAKWVGYLKNEDATWRTL